tara:strand:- start:24 stop:209 length:186 start_codon:yes stop_codon:yes gene_type:complete
MSKKKISFESSINNLNKILDKLENDNVDLEKMVELYSQGKQIIKYCRNELKSAEQKINKIN